MLLMKAWLETRWRLGLYFLMCLVCIALNYRGAGPSKARSLLIYLGTILAMGSMAFAGTGVKSQAPFGFPEGLAGSTLFTITLPISRFKLLTVRAAVGFLETIAVTLVVGLLTWALFPSVRAIAQPGDVAMLILNTLLFLTAPYCAAVFFATFLDEPLSSLYAGWTIALILWGAHHVAPAVDIVRSWGLESPLVTHTLPWPQMAASALLATVFFLAAVRVIQTREYE